MKTELHLKNRNLFQVGGSLPSNTPVYVKRQADEDFYAGLTAGEFCYVLNSRQMGKSSLRIQTMQQLKADGIACAVIDLTKIGSQNITPDQWYAGIVRTLVSSFDLANHVSLRGWWRDRDHLSPVQRLSEFIEEVLLPAIPQNIVIFVDEIDSVLSLKFSASDFFALVRNCYNQRADKSAYQRLTFALLGVATPSALVYDKTHTPFNIGRAIELRGFRLNEAQPLLQGLVNDKIDSPQAVLEVILSWTGGQPFLTQKLCQLVARAAERIPIGKEAKYIKNLVRSHLLDNWESQDEPEHLRTIRDRLLSSGHCSAQILTIYQQILQQGEIPANNTSSQMELRLSGLVVERLGKLKVSNEIYKTVFNQHWVDKALKKGESIYHHLLVLSDELGQRKIILDKPTYSIGRGPACDIRLVSPYASRHHATLVQLPSEDGTYFYRIVDGTLQGNRSANGLTIRGQKILSHDLNHEDIIFLGSSINFTYRRIVGLPPEGTDSTLGYEITTDIFDDVETDKETDLDK